MKKEKTKIKFYQVVNIDKESNEIQMLNYLFSYDKDLKGATGTHFEPVNKAQYREAMSKENIIDSIIDNGLIGYKHNKNIERKMAEILYKEMKIAGELESFCFDLSYTEQWEKLRAFGFPKSKYPIFNCIGDGRIFDKDFQGNVNPELSAKIRQYETPTPKKKK